MNVHLYHVPGGWSSKLESCSQNTRQTLRRRHGKLEDGSVIKRYPFPGVNEYITMTFLTHLFNCLQLDVATGRGGERGEKKPTAMRTVLYCTGHPVLHTFVPIDRFRDGLDMEAQILVSEVSTTGRGRRNDRRTTGMTAVRTHIQGSGDVGSRAPARSREKKRLHHN